MSPGPGRVANLFIRPGNDLTEVEWNADLQVPAAGGSSGPSSIAWEILDVTLSKVLKQGRVDATINDKLTYLDQQKTAKDDGIKIAAETTDKSLSAFAFRKGSSSLTDAVNKALSELQADGTLTKISQKYFDADVSK